MCAPLDLRRGDALQTQVADEMASVIRKDLDKSLDEAVAVLSENELKDKARVHQDCRLKRAPPSSTLREPRVCDVAGALACQ